MRLQTHEDVAAFLAAADSVLAADEPRHNLIYGICDTLVNTPTAYPEAYFWTVEEDETLAALLRTPPFNIVLAQPLRDEAITFAAEQLRSEGVDTPGVVGAVPEVDLFAQTWTDAPRLRMSTGIYAARKVRLPEEVPGAMRIAMPEDSELLVEWITAFDTEAIPADAPHVDVVEAVDRRVRSETAGFALWETDGRVVSMCGFGGRTPHGIRIGPVYTPPELRGHGYGSAVTAHATKCLLDGDRDYCFLYTDLANPTSNKIYMNIGYEFVCDSADYAFA